MQVNTIGQVRGNWPPPEQAILIERSSMPDLPAQVGDAIRVELPDGTRRTLPIAGVVHDLHQWPTPFLGTVYGYISRDTLEWLGEPRTFNQMLVRVAQHADSQAHNTAVAQQVYDKIRKAGLDPAFPQVPTPEEPPLEFVITAITALMSVMSVMAILLRGFLVVNTIGALLARQTRQTRHSQGDWRAFFPDHRHVSAAGDRFRAACAGSGGAAGASGNWGVYAGDCRLPQL